ncbi:MAG: thymidine phosphorylase [Clostridia bacterium]|nr:thymidine phosphorylase [Clostridia bacterium]
MRMYDLIKKKRDGLVLTDEEIRSFVFGYRDGTVPDYQAAAMCMAIYFRGMNADETASLTFAIRDSGEKLSFPNIDGLRVDKHSTGGVGDKTSLVVAPIVASLGCKVAKMSGRGLGHTGGTVDKLESIEGMRVEMDTDEFERIVNETGICIVGQTQSLAPADKKLYALRDVTATVDSMPLIVSSIMGKKLAADDDCIVLDVKTGSGSFMKTVEDSTRLAEMMVDIGKKAGKKTLALITDMDVPLGYAIGNSLEVIEAVDTLNGHGPSDLTEVCLTLASRMLHLAGHGTKKECEDAAREAISSGKALEALVKMVKAQGGNEKWILDTSLFPKAPFRLDVLSPADGYVTRVDTEGYGVASLLLGAGRNTKDDTIDYSAGIMLAKKTGDAVRRGDVIATLYASDEAKLAAAEKKLLSSTEFGPAAPEARPLILNEVE